MTGDAALPPLRLSSIRCLGNSALALSAGAVTQSPPRSAPEPDCPSRRRSRLRVIFLIIRSFPVISGHFGVGRGGQAPGRIGSGRGSGFIVERGYRGWQGGGVSGMGVRGRDDAMTQWGEGGWVSAFAGCRKCGSGPWNGLPWPLSRDGERSQGSPFPPGPAGYAAK